MLEKELTDAAIEKRVANGSHCDLASDCDGFSAANREPVRAGRPTKRKNSVNIGFG
jgi:hypothetical protein